MMQRFQTVLAVLFIAGCAMIFGAPAIAASPKEVLEYDREPLPPGIQVVNSELEGPVFADATGRTLYEWPLRAQRNNTAGEKPNEIGCYDVPTRESVGYTSPYPGGKLLPDPDNRPTCVQLWPPLYADADARPIGNWTILSRTDGKKQWAYKKRALYRSHLDRRPGETNGGTRRLPMDSTVRGAPRRPATPAPAIPPQFTIGPMALGLTLTDVTSGFSVYYFDKDTATKAYCNDTCLDEWRPMLAADITVARGDWTVLDRGGGIKQWVFRGKPLYVRSIDPKAQSYEGSDVPGWHNVFLQRVRPFPKGFQIADTVAGQVLADSRGKTIYYYQCFEDTADTLLCDSPDSPQVYRWAVCGGGDVARCLATFPYVVADKGAKSEGVAWSTMNIDPLSGRIASADTKNALRVWAFRGRPVYTFARDEAMGDIGADSWGQDHGQRNGFTAFWVRDDYKYKDGSAPYGQ